MSHSKTAQLRRALSSGDLSFLMEAHNALSARIAEEAGFAAIWASGFAISASLGVRDSNEASWTQVLEVAEFMADATTVPILLDGDTGYGDFNAVRRLVRKLESRGIAGVCLEDKVFPKTNSLLANGSHALVSPAEFCGKIRAAKDAQADDGFVVVARIESFVAGLGLSDALARAEAYREAGADAVLVHSNRHDADEVLSFAREWAGRAPLVLVPTTYASTPASVFREHGVSAVIWANHLLRASVAAMQHAARAIYATEGVSALSNAASIDEIFRLQDQAELDRARDLYSSPRTGRDPLR